MSNEYRLRYNTKKNSLDNTIFNNITNWWDKLLESISSLEVEL